jgi:uncharacterized protein YtpQ (UPF0354 family)
MTVGPRSNVAFVLALATLLAATNVRADPMPCPLPAGVDAEHVVPVLRNVGFIDSVQRSSPGLVPTRPIAGDVVVAYVEDGPTALRYFRIPESDRECWADRATQRASLHNLAHVVTNFRSAEAKAPGVSLVTTGGDFEPSFILTFGILRKVLDEPLEAYLVGIPNHDMLLVADPRNSAALKGLQGLVDKSFSNGDKPLSRHLVLVTRCTVTMVESTTAMEVTGCP